MNKIPTRVGVFYFVKMMRVTILGTPIRDKLLSDHFQVKKKKMEMIIVIGAESMIFLF